MKPSILRALAVSLCGIFLATSSDAQLLQASGASTGGLDPSFKNFRNFPVSLDSLGLKPSFLGAHQIRTAVVQADGKILIGGTFQIQQKSVVYFGSTAGVTVIWRNLARLNADGTLDTTFISESAVNLALQGLYNNTTKPLVWGPDQSVNNILVEFIGDGFQYIVAGDFLNFSHNNQGNAAPRLRYLVLDALTPNPLAGAAQPLLELAPERAAGFGFDSVVRKMRRISGESQIAQLVVADAAARQALTLLQAPAGTIVFQSDDGSYWVQTNQAPLVVADALARLALTLAQAPVGTIVLQSSDDSYWRRTASEDPDLIWEFLDSATNWTVVPGALEVKYFAMGDFVKVFDNDTQPYIVRLVRDGNSLGRDEDWDGNPNPNRPVNDIAVFADRNIFIGEFTSVSGVSRNRIAAVRDDGSLNLDFDPGTGFNGTAFSIAVEPVGQHLIVVGDFTEYNGVTANRIARIDIAGGIDATFPAPNNGNNSGANGLIRALTRQPDGRLLIAGSFTQYNGIPRPGVARLEADGSLDLTFSPQGDASGVFAFATDFDGGPGTASLFARPIVVGDFSSLYGSHFRGVARLLGGSYPVVWYQPNVVSDQVVAAGTTATMQIVAADTYAGYPGFPTPSPLPIPKAPSEPLSYQWQFNGRDIPGANQPSLALTNASYSQAGSYRVKIYNSQYERVSELVQLSVINPFIGIIPSSGVKVEGRVNPDAGLNMGLGGVINMTISRLGVVSGTLKMGGPGGRLVSTRFAGQFGGDGSLQISLPRLNQPALVLNLKMNFSGAPLDFTFVDGSTTLSDGTNTAVIGAWNKRWTSLNPATQLAGKYNVGLKTDPAGLAETVSTGTIERPELPQGNGYFAMTISATSGVARIAGVLPDGTKFTNSSTVWGDTPSTVQLWVPLYRNSGALQGVLNINSAIAGNPVAADLQWTKPAGINGTPGSFGFQDAGLTAWPGSGLYDPFAFMASLPAPPANFDLDFSDGIWTTANGGLTSSPFTQAFSIVGSGVTPVAPDARDVRMSLNTRSGMVTGSFRDLDLFGVARSVRYQAMILTQGPAPVVRGYFSMPNLSGSRDFYIGGSVDGE